MLEQLAKSYAQWLDYVVSHQPEIGKKIISYLFHTCLKPIDNNVNRAASNLLTEIEESVPTLITNLPDLIQVLWLAKPATWSAVSKYLVDSYAAQAFMLEQLMEVVQHILSFIELDTYGRGESLFTALLKAILAQEKQLGAYLQNLLEELANCINLNLLSMIESENNRIDYKIIDEINLQRGFAQFLNQIPKAIKQASELIKAIYSLIVQDIRTKQTIIDETNGNKIIAFFTLRLINPVLIKLASCYLKVRLQKKLWAEKIIPKMVQGITADITKSDMEYIVPNCLLQLLIDEEFKNEIKNDFLAPILLVNHLPVIKLSPRIYRSITFNKDVIYRVKLIEARSMVDSIIKLIEFNIENTDMILPIEAVENLLNYIKNLRATKGDATKKIIEDINEDHIAEKVKVETHAIIANTLFNLVNTVLSALSERANKLARSERDKKNTNLVLPVIDNNSVNENNLYVGEINDKLEELANYLTNEQIVQLLKPSITNIELVEKLINLNGLNLENNAIDKFEFEHDNLCRLSKELADICFIFNDNLQKIESVNANKNKDKDLSKIEECIGTASPLSFVLKNPEQFFEEYKSIHYQVVKSHLKQCYQDTEMLTKVILAGKLITASVEAYNKLGFFAHNSNEQVHNNHHTQQKEFKKVKRTLTIEKIFKKIECKIL